jgi:hypothetical protein
MDYFMILRRFLQYYSILPGSFADERLGDRQPEPFAAARIS